MKRWGAGALGTVRPDTGDDRHLANGPSAIGGPASGRIRYQVRTTSRLWYLGGSSSKVRIFVTTSLVPGSFEFFIASS
jgi:hypothetical protein